MKSNYNPRYKNGNRRRKMRERFKAMGLPCAICGRPIHYDEPSDYRHPLSFVIDEIVPISKYRAGGYDSPSDAALDWNNVQPTHYICNSRKSNKILVGGYGTDGVPGKNTGGNTQRTIVNIPDGNW